MSHNQNLKDKETENYFFDIIWNDGSEDQLDRLIELKNIFSAQLPKMPKEYITRLIMDRKHQSMCILKKNKKTNVIGGICFRPFFKENFAEIVFCAITGTEQVKGFGTKLMNQIKEYAKSQNISSFLTFADNFAIGYFKKQGFTKVANFFNSKWNGLIKEYDGGTLMECKISLKINYLRLRETIKLQQKFTQSQIKRISSSHKIYKGIISINRKKILLTDQEIYKNIPGLKSAGWKISMLTKTKSEFTKDSNVILAKIGGILKIIKSTKDSWPFIKAVDEKQVTDYYKIIKNPMDLAMITKKLNEKKYTTKNQFIEDFKLIITNCKMYNSKNSSYYICAERVDKIFDELISLLD